MKHSKFFILLVVLAIAGLEIGFQRPAFAQISKDQNPLSADDEAFLKEGRISEGKALTGALIGTALPIIPGYFLHSDQQDAGLRFQTSLLYVAFPTFGVGQLFQGRYLETGWWFTIGEGVLGALLYNSNQYGSINSGASAWGLLGLLGLRVWEVIDLWTGPGQHNRRWQELMDEKSKQKHVSFFVMPREESGQLGVEGLLQLTW